MGAQNPNGLHNPVLLLHACHGGLEVKKPHIELISRGAWAAYVQITAMVAFDTAIVL